LAVQSIGVLAHPQRPTSFPVAERIEETLQARGIQTWLYTVWEDSDVQADVRSVDMVVAIGGDGAMLKAARVCAPHAVPVLGVNMGHLGFLTEIAQPEDWEQYCDRVLRGDYWIEQRMMLDAAVLRGDDMLNRGIALNDVVISGTQIGRMTQLDTYIDGHWATTYNADALIVATATGSTAYALALGGPILPPELLNILIVPAAPHLSMDRPIVISEGSTVDVLPSESNRSSILLTVDGVVLGKVEQPDRIRIQASEHSSRFIRLRDRNYFYRSLLDRLEPRVNQHKPEAENLLSRITQYDRS
jgi:NAD+ kinase